MRMPRYLTYLNVCERVLAPYLYGRGTGAVISVISVIWYTFQLDLVHVQKFA